MFSMSGPCVYPCAAPDVPWFAGDRARGRHRSPVRDWAHLEPILRRDPIAMRLTVLLARKKSRLRGLLSEPAWRAYLGIEELELRRSLRWLELATRLRRRRER